LSKILILVFCLGALIFFTIVDKLDDAEDIVGVGIFYCFCFYYVYTYLYKMKMYYIGGFLEADNQDHKLGRQFLLAVGILGMSSVAYGLLFSA